MTQFDEKAPFRAAMRELRGAVRHCVPDAAAQAAARFPVDLGAFGTVAIYHPRGTEIDPFPLAARLGRHGARIALPVVVEKEAPLVFRIMSEGGALPPDALGVPSPGPDAEAVRPDLVVAPLLAFDRRGGRLGQGGGYYDRTIAGLRAQGPVFVLGLAYAGQELNHVPMSAHDERLDGVLTELGYRAARED